MRGLRAVVVSLIAITAQAETFYVTVIQEFDSERARCFVQLQNHIDLESQNRKVEPKPVRSPCIHAQAEVESTRLVTNEEFCGPVRERMDSVSSLFSRLVADTDVVLLAAINEWGETTTFRLFEDNCPIPDLRYTIQPMLSQEQLFPTFHKARSKDAGPPPYVPPAPKREIGVR